MNKDNFVNIVGYQLEKVHTGMIKWALDSSNGRLSQEDRFAVIARLYGHARVTPSFSIDDIHSVSCHTEYSFGRALKLDLLIDIELANKERHYVAVEMKVDSIPAETQLEQTRAVMEDLEDKFKDRTSYLLMLLGSSQVTQFPNKLHGFAVLMLEDIVSVFSPLKNLGHGHLDQWLEALGEEQERWASISNHILSVRLDRAEQWRALGYRTWFPTYYFIYDALRRELHPQRAWEIGSGMNNPLMNDPEPWLSISYRGCEADLYWEFNNQYLFLKMRPVNPLPSDILDSIIEEISYLCRKTTPCAIKTRDKKRGKHRAICKWRFDFHCEGLPQVAERADRIIGMVDPLLYALK